MRNCTCGRSFYRRISGRLLAPIAIASLLAASVVPAASAYYHDLAKNRQPCGDCHTLHYSESGAQPAKAAAGGPFAQLRIRSTTTQLCLFCHDGSDPKAPDVLASVGMYSESGDEHSGAGYFGNSGGSANLNGHDLGLSSSSPPFSTLSNVSLSCASCHDPHGTKNYSNLLTAPAGGAGVGAEMGTDLFRSVAPGNPPSASASIAAYKESNEGYKANSSKWCAECHNDLKPHVAGASRTENHHLVDVPINGSGFPTDPAHWLGGTGTGFGAATGDGAEGVPRLRFQVSGATDYASSRVAATNNQVMCGSCHFAHGGPYRNGLIWPYRESGSPADKESGCDQCHNY